MSLKPKLSKKQPKIIKDWYHKKISFIYFSCVCIKGVKSAKKLTKNVKLKLLRERYFWINRKDLEVESDQDNWGQIFDKCDLEKQKYRYKLMPNTEFQPCRRFVQNDLVEQKIKSCRRKSKKF